MTRRPGLFKKGENIGFQLTLTLKHANRPASTAAGSEPGSEISFLVDSGDDFSENNVIISKPGDYQVHESVGVTTVIVDTAMPTPSTALPAIDTWPCTAQYKHLMCQCVHGTIQTSDVPMSSLLSQATPSLAGTAVSMEYGIHCPLWSINASEHNE